MTIETGAPQNEEELNPIKELEQPDIVLSDTIPARRSRFGRKTKLAAFGIGIPLLFLAGTGAYASQHPDQSSEFLRNTIGDENTAKLEEKYFAFEDWKTRHLYELGFGPDEHPFKTPTYFVTNTQLPDVQSTDSQPTTTTIHSSDQALIFEPPPTPEPPKPKPFILPDTHILLPNPIAAEGSWSIDGLPTLPEQIIMAKTNIRPDAARPYSNVSVIVFDSRRINLNMVGGKGARAVGGGSGPGKVPDADLSNLLVVMNGGFQISHADGKWGAYLDGIEYQALKPGMASLVVFKDGSIKVGKWGEGVLATRTEDMVSVRQNTVLLVENGEVTPAAKDEANTDKWGLIAAESTAFITYRSAVGVDKDGNFIIADANDMSAYSLARGLVAAGAYTAMQMDINSYWVQTGIVSGHNTDGSPILKPFLNAGMANGSKFLKPQDRDLIYVTRSDDSRFKP